jgi:HSP20 family molecular chaperone IbpA
MNTRIVAKKISAKYENGMLAIVLPKDFRQQEDGEVKVPVEVAK